MPTMIRSIRLQNLSRSHGLNRCLSTKTRVAIIGSGPAGFYTAKYLLERNTEVNVDIIEKLPVPYGLVRYVAPDHPEVKSVQETFEKATNPRFRFFGNVELNPTSQSLLLRLDLIGCLLKIQMKKAMS